jgi:hypothetical protein
MQLNSHLNFVPTFIILRELASLIQHAFLWQCALITVFYAYPQHIISTNHTSVQDFLCFEVFGHEGL